MVEMVPAGEMPGVESADGAAPPPRPAPARSAEEVGGRREVGDQNQVWSLSTAKPGNGVEQLRDGDLETYWQSDGPQPHLVNIQFHKKTRVKEIEIYTEYAKDESYTPCSISVRAGTTFHDIQEVHAMELDEPNGWITVPLAPPSADARPGTPRPLPPALLRVLTADAALFGVGCRRAARVHSDVLHPAGDPVVPPERARHAHPPDPRLQPRRVRPAPLPPAWPRQLRLLNSSDGDSVQMFAARCGGASSCRASARRTSRSSKPSGDGIRPAARAQ